MAIALPAQARASRPDAVQLREVRFLARSFS
jgi:hypothetical protein